MPIADVAPGDVVVVRPGERVPVDERPGADVFGGTGNATGGFRFEATRLGRDTALLWIVQFVEGAQGRTAPIARLAGRVGGVFTPVVLLVAVLTFAGWMQLAPAATRFADALVAAECRPERGACLPRGRRASGTFAAAAVRARRARGRCGARSRWRAPCRAGCSSADGSWCAPLGVLGSWACSAPVDRARWPGSRSRAGALDVRRLVGHG